MLPSNLKVSRAGVVTLSLKLPDAGRVAIVVTAKGHKAIVASKHLAARRPETLKLTITLGNKAKKLLAALGSKARLTVLISFTPTGGTTRTRTFPNLHLGR